MSQPAPTLVTHLCASPAAEALAFYKKAFGFAENARMPMPDGKIMHAELQLGDQMLFVADEFDFDAGVRTPLSLGGTCCTINLLVADADAAFKRAIDAGATVVMPVELAFWGARYGQVADPFGHRWAFNQQVSQPTVEEMQQAMAAAFQAP